MPIQDHINSKNKNNRHQYFGNSLEDNIILRFIIAVPAFFCLGTVFSFFLIIAQQNQYGTGSNKQYIRLSKSIKSPIVQNHTRHDIYSSCILQSVFNIFGCHFITSWIVAASHRWKVRDLHQQNNNQCQTAQNACHFIKPAEKSIDRIMFNVICLLQHLFMIQAMLFQYFLIQDLFPLQCQFLRFLLWLAL